MNGINILDIVRHKTFDVTGKVIKIQCSPEDQSKYRKLGSL